MTHVFQLTIIKFCNSIQKILGFKKLLLNRGYDGEISMLCAPISDNPMTGPACVENCEKCSAKMKPNEMQKSVIKNTSENIADNKSDNYNEQTQNERINDLISNAHVNSIFIDTNAEKVANDDNGNANGHTVKTINGKFFMINCANISCACIRSPNGFSKYCHLCDGYIDLVLVRHTTFLNNLRFLLAMSSRNCKIVSILIRILI